MRWIPLLAAALLVALACAPSATAYGRVPVATGVLQHRACFLVTCTSTDWCTAQGGFVATADLALALVHVSGASACGELDAVYTNCTGTSETTLVCTRVIAGAVHRYADLTPTGSLRIDPPGTAARFVLTLTLDHAYTTVSGNVVRA